MTAHVLSTTDPRWQDARTVEEIAAGRYWALVSPAAHDLAHPQPVFDCPGCPQGEVCPSCGRIPGECPDPSGHARVWREGEASLLVGVATYGRTVGHGR